MTGNGLVVVDRPKIFSAFPEIVAGVSTREGGVSGPVLGLNLSFRVGDDPENVRENRRRFFGAFGMTESDAAIPQQVHSRRIVEAPSAGPYESCDGVFTDRTGMGLVVTVADCVPILLYDPKTGDRKSVV
jgi:copper oxidase (laccase) domain-containing protein